MGTLAYYLQSAFARHCPDGWTCYAEQPVLTAEIQALLGYAPQVDMLFARNDGKRRLWIEFEVSRADPVANHAKFATAHLFQPQPETDTFVAMVSAHVARGRQNLAANTIHLMRHVGMRAHQTVLLPHLDGATIKQLNHSSLGEIEQAGLAVEAEIERAMLVAEPLLAQAGHTLHFAGNLLDVLLNLRQWNQEIATTPGKALWGQRTVTYFVVDGVSGDFAPSKFCAYTAVPMVPGAMVGRGHMAQMTLAFYATLGETRRFDGHTARTHLVDRLGMQMVAPAAAPTIIAGRFAQWLARHEDVVRVHPAGPIFLAPPVWFG